MKMDRVMTKKRGFTLVEILVVVSIIALVAGLTIPAIKAMQAGSARAEALNTINAALQGVRSYAIINQVKAAARFQPNGKVVFVYRFEGNGSSRYINLGAVAATASSYPRSGTAGSGRPNDNGYIYLPVLDQEPLKMPKGYAVGDLGNADYFYEPFYICYNPDGTLANREPIWVAMIESETNREPINPDFDGGNFAWEPPARPASYTLIDWLDFTQNKIPSNDASKTLEINDRKLVRYYYVANGTSPTSLDLELTQIFENEEAGIDHYAGRYLPADITHQTLFRNSVSQIGLFKTPENWDQMNLYTGTPKTKRSIARSMLLPPTDPDYKPDQYESIYINPYTGRIIRANQ